MASVYEIKSGKWVCQWTVGRDRSGKKIRDSKTFDIKEAAIAHKVHVEEASFGSGKDSLGARWNVWIDERLALGAISQKTANGYRQYCSVWSKLVGQKALKKVTAADLSKALATLAQTETDRGSKPSAQTLRHYITALRTFLNDLVKSGELSRSPAMALTTPTPSRQPRRAPSKDELVALVDAAKRETRVYGLMPTLIRFAVNTGMRRGEIVALRWSDVDLNRGVVSVVRTVSQHGWSREDIVFRAPKTEAGVRDLPIADHVVTMLRDHRRQQSEQRLKAGPGWADNDLVFCDPIGQILDPSLISKVAGRIRDKAGLPREVLPLHGLRHFHLSAVLKGTGNDRASAKKRAGHASFASTERYITPDDEQDRAAAAAGSVEL